MRKNPNLIQYIQFDTVPYSSLFFLYVSYEIRKNDIYNMAPAPKRNTITDSSTASDRCMCSSLEFSRLRSNKSSLKL